MYPNWFSFEIGWGSQGMSRGFCSPVRSPTSLEEFGPFQIPVRWSIENTDHSSCNVRVLVDSFRVPIMHVVYSAAVDSQE